MQLLLAIKYHETVTGAGFLLKRCIWIVNYINLINGKYGGWTVLN